MAETAELVGDSLDGGLREGLGIGIGDGGEEGTEVKEGFTILAKEILGNEIGNERREVGLLHRE